MRKRWTAVAPVCRFSGPDPPSVRNRKTKKLPVGLRHHPNGRYGRYVPYQRRMLKMSVQPHPPNPCAVRTSEAENVARFRSRKDTPRRKGRPACERLIGTRHTPPHLPIGSEQRDASRLIRDNPSVRHRTGRVRCLFKRSPPRQRKPKRVPPGGNILREGLTEKHHQRHRARTGKQRAQSPCVEFSSHNFGNDHIMSTIPPAAPEAWPRKSIRSKNAAPGVRADSRRMCATAPFFSVST